MEIVEIEGKLWKVEDFEPLLNILKSPTEQNPCIISSFVVFFVYWLRVPLNYKWIT